MIYELAPDSANLGVEKAAQASAAIAEGVNTYRGHVTHPGVAESLHKQFRELASVL